MSVLLDYFFPIRAIAPIPAASVAFLKRACVVVKPKGDIDPDLIGKPQLCTTMTEVAALTDNEEASEAFNGGLNSVYILAVSDLDLEDVQHKDFFSYLISSDFIDSEIEGVEAVAASLTLGGLELVASEAGQAGNVLECNIVSGAEHSIVQTGDQIDIIIELGVTTMQDVVDMINGLANSPAIASTDSPADLADALDAQSGVFAGGADAIEEMKLGTFKGVTAVSSNHRDFLKRQAVIERRCAFKTTTNTKAKNMMYAFAALLGNPVGWTNQQFIAMPYSAGVETVGDAEILFDDRVSFVLDDEQFGRRLAFFVCGGEAIAAPYIVENLKIDLQSRGLTWVNMNQPDYTLPQAILLQDELEKVVDSYVQRRLIGGGEVMVTLQDDNFVGTSEVDIIKPRALWRLMGVIRQA